MYGGTAWKAHSYNPVKSRAHRVFYWYFTNVYYRRSFTSVNIWWQKIWAHDELIFIAFSVMFELLQVGDRIIKADEIIPLLANYQLLPVVTRCLLTRQLPQNAHLRKQRALVNSSMSKISSLQNGKLGWNVMAWAQSIRSPSHMGLKIEKFKQETWGWKLTSLIARHS